jgi:ribosomal protein S18 acetylase RimI-like enzyme
VGSFDLYWIAVRRGAQGGGVGRILLEAAEARIARDGGRGIYVETSTKDQYHPTRAFYEHFGYQKAAVLADFYAPGDGKVIYVKPVVVPRG